MDSLRLAAAASAAATAFTAFVFIACSSSDDGGSSSVGPGQNVKPELLFRALQADLVKTCGGTNGQCHVNGTFNSAPRWLANPDPYLSAKKYRGILPVTKEVSDSIVLTQLKHSGPTLTSSPALYQKVAEWLTAEVPGPPLPNTGKFSVQSGLNSIPLDNVASGLTGARITFLATDVNHVLTLDAIKLNAPKNANVKLDAPFFVILPRSGKVDANPDSNGFKGEATFPAGSVQDLYAAKMVLLRWDPAGQLKIVFQNIESTPGTSTGGDCTALDSFKSSALPAMQMPRDIYGQDDAGVVVPGPVVGQNSCIGCHSVEPPTEAVNAMDLRGFDTDPGKACSQARVWVNFQNKAQSTILLNPIGQANPQHPLKPLEASDPVVSGIQVWVNTEKEK